MSAAHFTETETGAAMICLASLAAVLESEARNDHLALPPVTTDSV